MTIRIRKLETAAERAEAEKIIADSFLREREEPEAEREAEVPGSEAWGAFDGEGRMVSALTTLRHEMTFEGGRISCGELHMAGTLPEARGQGAVRGLIGAILRDYRARGDLFATLIPFSFAFYRRFGFEAASELLFQKAEIGQFAGFRQEMAVRRILCQEDAELAREVYGRFAARLNLADLKTEEDWACGENGEMGRRDWMHADKPHYSYLFTDASGRARAYLTFLYVPDPQNPFVGTMEVPELIYDSPEALRSVFAFFYGMRAKITHVSLETPGDADLSLLLPEPDSVERRLKGYYTARALNPDKILAAMGQPEGAGEYGVRVTDGFLPENTGVYRVRFSGGKAERVLRDEGAADLEVSVETFCQLAAGLADLKAARYRPDTKVNGNAALLERVFTKRPLFLR